MGEVKIKKKRDWVVFMIINIMISIGVFIIFCWTDYLLYAMMGIVLMWVFSAIVFTKKRPTQPKQYSVYLECSNCKKELFGYISRGTNVQEFLKDYECPKCGLKRMFHKKGCC